VKGQVSTNSSILRKASQEASLKEKDLANKLLILSRQKGWPLTITNKKGSRALLVGIDSKGYPLYVSSNDNIISAATIKTNLLWPGGSTGLNLSGSTIPKGKLAIWDEGKPRPTHVELVNRIVQKDGALSLADHSTHVAGTMIASGVNPAAKGMAFGALQLSAYDFNNHLSEMLGESPNLLVSNHSYGTIAGWNFNSDDNRWEFWGNFGDTVDYKFGYYSSDAQVWDSIAYNAPFYLIVKSVGNNREENGPAVGQPYWRFNSSHVMASAGNRPAGISNNDGYDIIPTYGVAKNILTVGSIYPIPSGYTQPSDAVLAEFSSWGPTDDGRIKPDVVTDGVDVTSSIATSDNAYASFSGSSMSTPAASGSSYLLQEYYARLHGGTFMRSATVKGIIIHTADEAGPAAGPDYQYGWGVINMEKAASVVTSNNSDQLIYENNLLNGNSFSLPVVASGKGSLVATISWTDPKGDVDETNLVNNPAKKLVNDLDIRITSGANTYMPWTLDRKHPGNAATPGDDTLNNVEKIVIANATPGQTYNIKVTHKGTLDRGQQAYSLLVSGVGGSSYCASAATSSAGTRIDSVIMSNIRNGNPPGCTTYTNFTNVTAQIQSDQSIPFTIKLSSCDGTTNSRIVKIYIDYNNNGLFTDPGEEVAQSAILSGGLTNFTGTIVTPSGLKPGNFTLMRVVAVETTNPAVVVPCGNYANGETQDYRVQIVAASNDLGVSQVVDPLGAVCANDSQRVSIRIKNFGTSDQFNVPVTVTITNGATVIATLNAIFPDTVPALGEAIYTFQSPFQMQVGNTYTITSKTNLAGDQDPTNDQYVGTVTVGQGVNNARGFAEICSEDPTSVALSANLPDTNDLPVWFDSQTSTTPIAAGAKTSTTVLPSNKVYYMALNEIDNFVGPKNKMVFPEGGYNEFNGNFIKFTNTVPVTLQTARLYIGHGGKIRFTVADIVNYNPSNGSFSYFPISQNTLDVYPTTPNPQPGAVTGNNAADTGAVYLLNLPVPFAGDHAIIIECLEGASIFRNNNIATNPYPFSIPGAFYITGNSAVNSANLNDTTYYRKFYYFFYNMQVLLANCPSPRKAVAATNATPPVITLNGKVLTSNVAVGNQWYVNDTAIAGATGQTDTVSIPGVYKTVVTDSIGCQLSSNEVIYTPGNGIGLTVGPNPNNGNFLVQFYLAESANVTINFVNALGQRIYTANYPNYGGVFSKQLRIPSLSAGIYFLSIQIGNNKYAQKIMIR